MADVSNAQKLASARKKFRELKKAKKENTAQKVKANVESTPSSREQTPVENAFCASPDITQQAVPAQLPNYFNDVNTNNGYGQQHQQPTAFFDTFIQNNDNYIPFATSANIFPADNLISTTDLKNDIPQNNHAEEKKPEVIESATEHAIESDNKAIASEEISNFHAFDSVKLNQDLPPPPELCPVESLQQLSNEMAELIKPSFDFSSSNTQSQLEIRNQELAALLNQEKKKTEELNVTLREYQTRMAQLESENKQNYHIAETRIQQEVSRLREELQCHVQTVGILVAEKAELSANFNQFQLVAKQKTAECEELQGRLKTSRSRVADLEREVALLKNEKSQFDSLGKERNSELEKLKQDHQRLKEEKDELMQDLLEVREKLKTSSENALQLQHQIRDLSNQLSMANLKIQQLTVGELDQNNGQIEHLTQEKFALEKQVSDLTQTIKTLSKEREESSLQHQQYAQQLYAQLTNLATKLDQLQKENESLQIQEQNRIKHIGELEKQLQNIQDDQVSFAVQRNTSDTKAELDAAIESVERLRTENIELQEENVKILNEKELLLKDLELKEETMKALEETVEKLRGSQPDNAKLLAIMESDKVAAARAVSQNSELKKQMESMQEVFMKLNNDKIELTENLTMEQRNNKDLFEKLQKTELHLQTLADAIEIKDKELSHLRENSAELNKQVLQSEQLTDRLRHYEAQDHSSQSLQSQLQEERLKVAKLTEEINHLNNEKKTVSLDQINGDDNRKDEGELAELKRQIETLELKNKELEAKLSGSEGSSEQPATDNNHNDHYGPLDRESAMKHLEEKFLRTMEEIANLTEEKQRLEHLVLQLQGETETIGEYVALYQHQRSILKQKAIEKDQQLSQLASDREHMKNKLEKLNELVKKLVLEKGAVPPELLEQHDSQLCEEHAKINSEISKIAQSNSFTVEPSNGDDPQSTQTAEQIIALLSEIKTSNLIQPAENFHHCPWCSGKLMTV